MRKNFHTDAMATVHYLLFSGDRQRDCSTFHHWLALMPRPARERIEGYRRWQDALNCLAGQVLVARAFQHLGDAASIFAQLEKGAYGRPYLNHAGACDFNISHAGALVVCAVSEGRIGIDAEQLRRVELDSYTGQMLPEERESLAASAEPDLAFFRYWTQKEAVAKANGKGLGLGFKSFCVRNSRATAEGREWQVHPLSIAAGYVAHLACDRPPNDILLSDAASFFEAPPGLPAEGASKAPPLSGHHHHQTIAH